VIKYLLILIIVIATFWPMQFSLSLESDETKLMESIKNLKLDNNTIIAINPTFTDHQSPSMVSSFLPLSSYREGSNLISTISVPTNHLISSQYGNTYSPFKPCIIDPSSSALSTSASYQIHGKAKISNPSENGNYTTSEWLRIDLHSDPFNQVTGYLSFGDIHANINLDPIVTQCFNQKDFRYTSPSPPVIAGGASQINPPFKSCPAGFEIEYAISAQVEHKNQVISIRDPNDMSFSLNINSDFRTGELRNTMSFPGVYETLNIGIISTTCTTRS
jgi:hypothetical protein